MKLEKIKSNVGFFITGENRITRRITSLGRVENQQTQLTHGIESGIRSQASIVDGEWSHHCTNPASHGKIKKIKLI